MGDYFSQAVREANIHLIVKEITAFADCNETRQMLLGALQLPLSIGGDLEERYRLGGCNSHVYFTGVISKWISLKRNGANTVELDKALRDIGWNAAADNVKDKWFSASRSTATEETDTSSTSKSGQSNNEPIWFNMRDPIFSFTGRVDTLEKVHNIFFPGNLGQQDKSYCKTKLTQVAVVGLGWIGKSEFAKKFATVYYNEFDRNVARIKSETAHLLQESFKELAAEIGIDTTNVSGKKDFLEMIKSVYKRIGASNSLFIFDNVESWFDGEDAVKEYLPRGLGPDFKAPYELMTSRNRLKMSRSVEIVDLPVLTETEAAQLIQHRLGTENSEFPLHLAKLLGCLPLALQQAISYIQQEIEDDISGMARQEVVAKYIQSYIDIFDNEVKFLDYKDRDFDSDFDELKTTRVTWRVTLEKIQVKNSSAIPLLTMMSYMSPGGIYLDMFEAKFIDDDLRAAVNALLDFSMITKNSVQSNIISVHRLVQRVMRLENEEKLESTRGNEDTENKSLASVLDLLNIILYDLPDKITSYTTSCVVQAQVAWEHALAYPKLLKQFKEYPGNLCSKAALHGVHTNTFSLLERTLSKYKLYIIYRESSEQYIRIQHFIAIELLKQGKYEDAKSLCKLIHKTAENELGESHQLTLNILNNLNIAECGLGNYSEEMTILEKIIAVRTASPSLGPYHKDTLTYRHNKAACLAKMEKYDEALQLFKSTLELMEKHHPEDRKSIISTRYMVAHRTQRQGNFAEALHMFRNLHAELVESFGESHSDTQRCAQRIRECLLGLWKCEEAMKVLKYNLNLANDTPGARLQCVVMKYSIARVLLKMERYDEAISQFRVVLGELLSIYGKTQPEVLTSREYLAIALQHAGRTEEVLEHYIFVYENRLKTLGAEHPDTIRVKKSMKSFVGRQS